MLTLLFVILNICLKKILVMVSKVTKRKLYNFHNDLSTLID